MLISVDGLDFSGKTTIAKRISDITKYEYVKVQKGSILDFSGCKDENDITMKIIKEISEGINGHENIVLDRNYISAIVTGKIYDSKSQAFRY